MTVAESPTNVKQEPEAFDSVLKEVSERRDEFTELRYVPRDMIQKFKMLGLYRVSTPTQFGGNPTPPADVLEMIERIAMVDGSAGWVASFGSQNVYLAGLPLETQAELYKDGPDVAFTAGVWPVNPVEDTGRGTVIVNGRWKFASGSKGSDILGVGIPGDDTTSGKPRTALLRPEQVEIIEEWDTIGMRGTGSFELAVHNVEVPKEWTFIRGGETTVDEPLYQYPIITYAAQVLAVCNLGIARAALDFAEEVGSGRTGVTGAPKLANRAYYRTGIAESEADLLSARAFFYEATRDGWQTLVAGDRMSDRQNALIRLASTRVAQVGDDVVRTVYRLSGTGAINNSHPLQPLLRDAAVPPQHAFLTSSIYDAAGAVLMGMEPTVPGFR